MSIKRILHQLYECLHVAFHQNKKGLVFTRSEKGKEFYKDRNKKMVLQQKAQGVQSTREKKQKVKKLRSLITLQC